MGGKTKQSQRTKNNVRPSSSGRSALLLDNVKLNTGVMKIGGTELPALFPSLAAPNVDPLLSPELQLCIKKLNKKDPITKTKALQELSELVSNSKVEDVVAMLPNWAHFYKLLTIDPNRKVRELAQSCHACIVSACGRSVAPHLKALVPAWLQATFDEHAPAQTHAKASLMKTFPDNKLPEVISFCKNEIVAHLVDNLIGTGEAAFIRKTDTAEEKELQLARILSSSLHLLQYCCQHLPPQLDSWLREQLQPLLNSNVFWKRASHTDSRIRAAWYSTIGRMIERYKGELAAQYGQKTLRILIGAKETSLFAAAQLWDALLLFMHNVEEWYKYLDKAELLSKRILDVLESGGWGDARHLSNILLPLLAHLPPDMLTKHFYTLFFNAIFDGLDKKTILSSKSERQSWITSLDECLRYISKQDQDFITEVVTSVHRTWLERILADSHEGQVRTNLIKHSAGTMAALVKYWLKQAKESQSEKYDQLIRNFWQNVGSTVTAQVDKCSTDHADIAKLMEGHILLLQTLKTSFVQEAKKHQSIKFDGDSPSEVPKPKETERCDATFVERYNHNLNNAVQIICGHYLEFAMSKQISNPVVTPLITLLVDFDSEALYAGVARHLGADCPYALYERVWRGWLAGDAMRCKAVVDVIFLMLKHLSDSEQAALFDTCKQFPPSVVEWCISLSLSHPHCVSPSVKRWLAGPLVETTLYSICTRVINTGDSKAKNLLLQCLNHDAHGEMIISPSAVSKILAEISAAMSCVELPALESLARLGATLCSTMAAHGGLVLALFHVSARVPRGCGLLSVETWCEVLAAWQDGLASLEGAERTRVLNQASDIVHGYLQLDESSADVKHVEHVISLCPHLLSSDSRQDAAEIVEFTRVVFDLTPVEPAKIETFVSRHMIIRGEINCPFDDGDVTVFITRDHTEDAIEEVVKEDLVSFMRSCSFKAVYLRTLLLHKLDEDLEDTWCNDLLVDDYIVAEFCKVIHDHWVIDYYYRTYAFWPHFMLINQTKQKVQKLIDNVIAECTVTTKHRILSVLTELSATKGYLWSFARRWFEVNAEIDLTGRGIEKEYKQKPDDVEVGSEILSVQENEETSKDQIKGEDIQENTDSGRDEAEDKKPEHEALDLENIITGKGYFHALQANETPSTALRTKYLLMLRSLYAAHCSEPDVVGGRFVRDVAAGSGACDADVIVNAYYNHNHVMLYEQDVSESPWSQVVSNAAVADYLTALVSARGWDLPAHQWDFITITLCNLFTSVVKSRHRWGSTKVSMLSRAVLALFLQVETFVSSVEAECMKRQPSAHVAHLPHEWGDIFAPDLFANLFDMDMFVLDRSAHTVVSANHVAVLELLMKSTRRLRWRLIPAKRRGGGGGGAGPSTERAARLLANTTHYCFKYVAYELMLALLETNLLDDAAALDAWMSAGDGSEEGEDRPLPPLSLRHYDAAYWAIQELVVTAVAHVRVCEATCELAEFTDVHRLALGWFLLAEVMGRHCRMARGELHHHYIQIYRDHKYLEPLLMTALRLLPAKVFAHSQREEATAPPPLPAHLALFSSMPELGVYIHCSGSTVSSAACRALYWCCAGAGVGDARGWRGAAQHRHARTIDSLVEAYIAPHVVKHELTQLQQRASEIEDTEVTILWSSYEVIAVLTMEDRPIELKVTLSRSHPLGLPQIVTPDNAPIRNTSWLVMYIGYQNASVLNTLKVWKDAVTSRVERSPQCFVCYCRLHHATGRLPSSYCRQCKNKFHTVCLRKWFVSSNKNTCPMCRSSF